MASHKDFLNLIDGLLDHETPIENRKIPKGRGPYVGRNTQLSQSFWLSSVFTLNEIHACRHEFEQVLSDPQIYYNWELEFFREEGKGAIASGKKTLGMYRRKHREGMLYVGQSKPVLYSFKYSREKHPLKDGKSERTFLSFNDCRQLCLDAKVADPRFFTHEELIMIKQHAKKEGDLALWSIPTKKQYDDLNNSVVGGIYDSMITREKWMSKEVPPDFSPPER